MSTLWIYYDLRPNAWDFALIIFASLDRVACQVEDVE